MIKRQYEGNDRRALNMIWNAAGRYDFEPPFFAFFPDGSPDMYFNMVIGFAEKWLDLPRIEAFMERYGGDRRRDEFDAFLWLGIENCVFEKERSQRPILEALRKERAAAFFKKAAEMSRQQMMLQSIPVYEQEEARWSQVLGRKGSVRSGRGRELSKRLCFSGQDTTEDVLAQMTALLADLFHAVLSSPRVGSSGKLWKGAAVLRQKILPAPPPDMLFVRRGSGRGNESGAVQLVHQFAGAPSKAGEMAERDLAYIQECFGGAIYSPREMEILEAMLCRDKDANCRLYICDGQRPNRKGPGEKKDKELQSKRMQAERNRAYYEANARSIWESIKALSAELEVLFASYRHLLPERSHHGNLDAPLAYRLPVFGDTKVFRTEGEVTEFEISVDLLLDASQSRMNFQEEIAAQAYVITKSLSQMHIPVRVQTFRSIRGFTVIERLKDYEKDACDGIWNYYAAGWNRDALSLKTMDALLQNEKREGERKHILLVLTDASPNDATPMAEPENRLRQREYDGRKAVEAASEAVHGLLKHNVLTGAVFYGASAHLANVRQIYGDHYVRILKMRQLSQAVSLLLKRSLQEQG